MKYIKKFENLSENTDNMFYRVSVPISKDKFEALLWRLGEDPENHVTFVRTVSGDISNSKHEYFYMSLEKKEAKPILRLGWMQGNQGGYDYYIDNGYNYGGVIEATPEDIETYNLYLDTKKYNL